MEKNPREGGVSWREGTVTFRATALRGLLEKPGKPLVFRQGMKGQNLSFIISSIRLFFRKNPIER